MPKGFELEISIVQETGDQTSLISGDKESC